MKLYDQLVARGEAADKRAGEIADQEEARAKRRDAYTSLENEFDAMAADGSIDKKELATLLADFKAAGLDTSVLDALAKDLKDRDRVDVTPDLRDKIGEQLQDAKFATKDQSFYFEAQELMSMHQQSFDLASRVSKAENEIYMVAIRHLAC